ncbi:mitochondrial intermediate peptidase [Vararia minispora EC-137]|uniref:Mitochondrial intermediate peptidase n=1 Tax=Vararia minispora EC-137 TaxID=1314806 RepID=A0ACB8QHU1_9AGAM|nr:mitochondrial intermediate peptidase [Vararia minispora EC-137]
MLARNATAAVKTSTRNIKRYRPRALRIRSLATARHPPCPIEAELVALFDHPQNPSASPLAPTGLFNQPALASPTSFHSLTHATLLRAHLLTERIVRARGNRDELFKVVKNLDRLSDLLCSVIDLAELLRNAHPEPKWVEGANDAYERLCEYMNVLNTSTGLYDVLKDVLSDSEITKTLSREAYYTALIFWRDFEKSGINLPPEQRDRFVSLSSEILSLGRQFLHEAQSSRPPAIIEPSELEGLKDLGMGSRLRWQSRSTGRDLLVYPGSLQAQMILRSAPAEEPRRKVYIASNSSTPEQIEVLEALLRARGELAQLVGSPSFAHMTLGDKMAKSPENVKQFLETLMDHTRPHALKALQTLSERKQAHLNTPPSPTIQAWDRDYYCPPEPPAPPLPLPPLTIGTVMRALSRLFSHLYGVTLRPADTAPGEVWHADVRKLEVVDESDGLLGWIYADLFARRGKASGAAHYAVRCSRRVDDDDVAGDLRPTGEYEALEGVSREFEARGHRRMRDGVFQLPAVALLTEFARPSIARGPTVLEWHEVLTLYHEMGHAMHSMIGRTDYQNVSGTRCPTDFVELPSILMEHFLTSPTVLTLFGDHADPSARPAGNHHEDPCRNIDTYGQILLAALDQVYHSPAVTAPGFDSTAALARLHDQRGIIPYVPGTSWQTQFGHLFGYGATYYAYLFDRAIASRVWRQVFSPDPLSREAGERYKREILRFGGGEDPWAMLGNLLGQPQLASGDEEAMREVGRWRIEEDLAVPGRH